MEGEKGRGRPKKAQRGHKSTEQKILLENLIKNETI